MILEYIIHQKKLNARKLREYQKQLDRKQQEIDEQNANNHQKKINKFLEKEATYSVNQTVKNSSLIKRSRSTNTISSFNTKYRFNTSIDS